MCRRNRKNLRWNKLFMILRCLIPLVMLIGNHYSFFILLLSKLFDVIADYVFDFVDKGNKFSQFLKNIKNTIVFLCTFFINSIIALHRRINENGADKFAFKLGYGANLHSALLLLSKMDLHTRNPSVTERLQATHPNIFIRIFNLEQMLNKGNAVHEEQDFS